VLVMVSGAVTLGGRTSTPGFGSLLLILTGLGIEHRQFGLSGLMVAQLEPVGQDVVAPEQMMPGDGSVNIGPVGQGNVFRYGIQNKPRIIG